MSINPYEAPQTFDAPFVHPDDPEEIRKQHINTEASIKAIGGLYYLVGAVMLLGGVTSFANVSSINDLTELAEATAYGLFLFGGFVLFVVASAVRRLKPWSRIGIGIVSGIGLLGFPVGTIINAYILFLTFGKKGRMVFSDRYKEIIALTPQVKCRTSKLVWILLATIVLFVLLLGLSFSPPLD